MSLTERNPTEVASCGCPYDPEYDADSLGWHLVENHLPEEIAHVRRDLNHALDRLDVLAWVLWGGDDAGGAPAERRAT
jgi:hypothetical protein